MWPMIIMGAMQLASSYMNRKNYNDPSDDAGDTLNKVPDTMKPYYENYMEGGLHPGQRLNDIGADYQQSPGYQFALTQALQGGNHAAASGGMAGSPQHELQNMDIASQLASRDYGNWMQNALNVYGQGAQSSHQMAQSVLDSMLSKAKLEYEGTNAQNQNSGGSLGGMLGGAGTMLSGFFK